MSTRFHTLNIKDIQKETKDCVSVAFEVPLQLESDFNYTPGQHLVLKANINGEEIRRSYSICSSPSEKELRVAIKQIEGGKFSTFANNDLKIGDPLDIMPPSGNFGSDERTKKGGEYVAVAAGSGITPIISIIKTTLEENSDSNFTLFYGNKSQQSIIFNEQLAALKNQYMGRLRMFHILSQENPGSDLFFGRINDEKIKGFSEKLFNPATIDSYYICGPADMTEDVRKTLESIGVPSSKIHFELFTAPNQKIVQKATRAVTESFEVQVEIKIDNDSYIITSPDNQDTLLDMASKAGNDLPFSCKGGVCCTCRAKVTEGEVEMDVNYALEEDEVAAGYILTCQARPKTKKVAVDFDA